LNLKALNLKNPLDIQVAGFIVLPALDIPTREERGSVCGSL